MNCAMEFDPDVLYTFCVQFYRECTNSLVLLPHRYFAIFNLFTFQFITFVFLICI